MKYKLSFTLFCALVPSIALAQTYLTTEHVDLNIKYTSATNTWDMVARDDDNAIEIPAVDVRLVVPDAAIISRPAGSNYDFTGVGAGQNLYVLPSLQDPALLFLGAASYGTVPSNQWDQYNVSSEAGGRLTSSPGRWMRLKLESVMGASGAAAPGIFSAWQDGFAGPNAFMSSSDGITNSGTATDDSIWVLSNGHSHYNWGFSAPGTYLATFRPSGRQNDNNASTIGALIESADAFTFTFQVGSASVPEPGTVLLFVCAPVILWKRRNDKKGQKKCV
jgi:surface-anchored protein